jgi:hypothetical protein
VPDRRLRRPDPRTDLVVLLGGAALIGLLLVNFGPSGGAPAATGTSQAEATDAVVALAPATSAPPVTTTRARAAASTPSTTSATSTTAAPPTTTTVDPGTLPQTDEQPTASGAQFTAGVQGLWEAVRQDRPELGLAFFFPKSAYLQVKAISDPATDYNQRLIANYAQDVHTMHAQLGANAASAQFVGIDVPSGQAVLVRPGAEYNKGSYWRVYGTTVRYRVDGQERTFPVTSMISWRGQWYVVHLGTIR